MHYEKVNNIVFDFAQICGEAANQEKSKTLEILPGGLSSAQNFKFELKNKLYVLRCFASSMDIETKRRQISIAQNAASIGVGPKIHFVDSNFDAFVMDFILGETARPQDFENDSHILKMAYCLKTFHNSAANFPIAVSPFERFRGFLARAEKNKRTLPKEFEHIQLIMDTIETLFAKHAIPLVPCHLDLHPLNIMFTEDQILLIDWANGGLSNPYFDLGTFALFHGLKDEQRERLLFHYFSRQATMLENDLCMIAGPVRLFVIAAAYLSMPLVENNERRFELSIDLRAFIQMQVEGTMNLEYEHIGLIMLKEGLLLIEDLNFKAPLVNLQKNHF